MTWADPAGGVGGHGCFWSWEQMDIFSKGPSEGITLRGPPDVLTDLHVGGMVMLLVHPIFNAD